MSKTGGVVRHVPLGAARAHPKVAERARGAAAAAVDDDAPAARPRVGRGSRQSVGEAMLKSTVRAIGSRPGRQLVRGILGSLLGGRK